jgi:hypothetical protein
MTENIWAIKGQFKTLNIPRSKGDDRTKVDRVSYSTGSLITFVLGALDFNKIVRPINQ